MQCPLRSPAIVDPRRWGVVTSHNKPCTLYTVRRRTNVHGPSGTGTVPGLGQGPGPGPGQGGVRRVERRVDLRARDIASRPYARPAAVYCGLHKVVLCVRAALEREPCAIEGIWHA